MNTDNGQNGSTSPLRWLLVAIPILIIGIAGIDLVGQGPASLQQAERERAAQEGNGRPSERTDEARGEQSPAGAAQPDFIPAPPPVARTPFEADVVVSLLPVASIQEGATAFRMCRPCHVAAAGAAPTIGPNLWGVAGRRKAAQAGYNYSAALSAKGGTWTARELAAFLHDPRAFVPGTSMAFRGMESERRIANMIAYLGTLSDNSTSPPD